MIPLPSLGHRRLLTVIVMAALVAVSARAQQLSVANSESAREFRIIEFPLQGLRIEQVKLTNLATGDVSGHAIDQNGRAVDLCALLRIERLLRARSPKAKLHPRLATALSLQPKTAHRVVLWLAYDDEAIDSFAATQDAAIEDRNSGAELAAAESATQAFAVGMINQVNQRMQGQIEALGIDLRYVSTTAPALFVDATAQEVMTLAASPLVDTLYLESDKEKDTNTSANATHRANTTYNMNWRGSGVRVAVLENNGIDPACPHLNVTQWFNAGNPNPDDHVHGTSGCVASTLSSRRGGAPSVSLYSANAASYSDTNITQASDWIASRNIDATNMSFGGTYSGALQYKDRYFDYQSRVLQDSYVASAGNSGGFVGSPGTAWNCITVGSFNDNDNSSWSGDSISSFSGHQNPTTGCEKPNLAATGQLVDTIGMGPDWLRDNYSGTSFSSPFTAAALAVAMSRDGTAKYSPEAAMAAMMATAWHNIEGSTRLSAKDGAGGLHQLAAAKCGSANRIRARTLNSGSFSNNGYNTYNISLTAGDRARVCIAWSANANSAYTSTVLQADLDITILAGSNATSGSSFGSSSSANNNFEIVEFTPPTTGTYTIRINDWSFNGSSERVGIAWSQRNLDSGN